jgi:hypothetical protein
MMKAASVAALLLCLTPAAALAQMQEIKGVKANQDCREPARVATGAVKTCAIDAERTRIWCPNGRVFDRHTFSGPDVGIAVLRSICELNQLPG